MSSGLVTRDFRPVIVIPCFNHGESIARALHCAAELSLPVVVVDDGSTDCTAEAVQRFAAEQPAGAAAVEVIRHATNQGKAAALHSGFRHAIAEGFTHALTLDASGAHDAAGARAVLEAARNQPDALVVGQRSGAAPDRGRSDGLRRLVNLTLHMQSGVRLSDNQCGLRVYPMTLVEKLPCRSRRYAFEAEVITRAVWAGGEVALVPVETPARIGPSHYRAWRDTLGLMALQVHLLVLALWPWHKRRWTTRPHAAAKVSVWRALASWLNPMRAVRELVSDDVPAGEVGAAVATGVFVASMPIPLLQTVAIFYLAGRWHLNPMIAFIASFYSTPPLIVAVMGGQIIVGHLLLSWEWPNLADYDLAHLSLSELAGRTLLELLVGAAVVGTAMALISFLLTVRLVRGVRRQRLRVNAAAANHASGVTLSNAPTTGGSSG